MSKSHILSYTTFLSADNNILFDTRSHGGKSYIGLIYMPSCNFFWLIISIEIFLLCSKIFCGSLMTCKVFRQNILGCSIKPNKPETKIELEDQVLRDS